MTIQEDIEALAAQNQRLMKDLSTHGVSLDVLSMLKMRLDYVTDFVLGGDPERSLQFGLGWETALNEALTGAQAEVTKARLHVPMAGQLSLVDGI